MRKSTALTTTDEDLARAQTYMHCREAVFQIRRIGWTDTVQGPAAQRRSPQERKSCGL